MTYAVDVGAATYIIRATDRAGNSRMASTWEPNGALKQLPDDLAPDYQGYGYTSRVTARQAAAFLNEQETACT